MHWIGTGTAYRKSFALVRSYKGKQKQVGGSRCVSENLCNALVYSDTQ